MTTLAVATPHALVVVLSVSHGLLFCQPPSFAAARMPPLLSESSVTINTRCPAACAQLDAANPSLSITASATALAYYRSGANSVADSRILAPAPTNDDAAVSSTLSCARLILSYARFTDETSRSESGDPVCRPI